MTVKISKLIAMFRARWKLRKYNVGRRIIIESGSSLGFNGEVSIGDRVSIAKGVGIGMNGHRPVLKIGAGTYIQPQTRILVRERVEIGEGCAISWNVDIMDTDFHGIVEIDGSTPAVTAPIAIGDRVWIGAGAKILKGATIGHDSVIAAGAVVTKSFPPHSVIAGIPAKLIRQIQGWTI